MSSNRATVGRSRCIHAQLSFAVALAEFSSSRESELRVCTLYQVRPRLVKTWTCFPKEGQGQIVNSDQEIEACECEDTMIVMNGHK
jgi:hypothetical protein